MSFAVKTHDCHRIVCCNPSSDGSCCHITTIYLPFLKGMGERLAAKPYDWRRRGLHGAQRPIQ